MTSRPRILVIDNDEDLLRVITTRLDHHGHACVTATSGGQGVALFADGGIEVVITDLNLPGGDGVAVVEEIRRHSQVPIIIVTGFAEEFRERLHGVPNIEWRTKPFDAEGLTRLVETHLSHAPSTSA